MQTPPNRNLSILRTLVDHQVEFLIVGGVTAVLQGAPISMLVVEVVHSTDPANISRVLAALEELDAIYRAQPELRLRPNASHLSSAGHQLLITRLGPLDVLGSIGNGRTYPDLLMHHAHDGTEGRPLNVGQSPGPGNADRHQGRGGGRKGSGGAADSAAHPRGAPERVNTPPVPGRAVQRAQRG